MERSDAHIDPEAEEAGADIEAGGAAGDSSGWARRQQALRLVLLLLCVCVAVLLAGAGTTLLLLHARYRGDGEAGGHQGVALVGGAAAEPPGSADGALLQVNQLTPSLIEHAVDAALLNHSHT